MFLLIAAATYIQSARLGVEFISVETQASRLALVVKRFFFSDLELNNIAEV